MFQRDPAAEPERRVSDRLVTTVAGRCTGATLGRRWNPARRHRYFELNPITREWGRRITWRISAADRSKTPSYLGQPGVIRGCASNPECPAGGGLRILDTRGEVRRFGLHSAAGRAGRIRNRDRRERDRWTNRVSPLRGQHLGIKVGLWAYQQDVTVRRDGPQPYHAEVLTTPGGHTIGPTIPFADPDSVRPRWRWRTKPPAPRVSKSESGSA